jgi:mono/diheme cytochrome c family protein
VVTFSPLAHSQTEADGARVYAASCVACHQPTGAGIPGAFPPLTKHVPKLLGETDGRDYLIKAVLFGLEGKVRIEGADYQNVMPPWNALSDAEVAAVLTYVSSAWGNQAALPAAFKSFTPGEVKAGRLPAQTASAVLAGRPGGANAGSASAAGASQKVAFTAEQVARGKGIYTRRCVDCHGSTLDNGEFGGAPLNGAYFKGHWGAGPVAALIAYTRARMPPDGPGSLSDQSYVDVVSYLLDANGYPRSDKELPADAETQQSMSLQFGP